MAAENDIQFFEAPFQYSIGEFSSNVNLTYHKLINTRPVKMPQMNTGFETPFSQAYNEKGDKSYFGIRKREGFQRCNNIEYVVSTAMLEPSVNYIITDHQIVNGTRFLMVCDTTFTKMVILKQDPGNYLGCDNQPQDMCDGEWKAVSGSESGHTYFKTTPCAYHKFQKIPTLQNEKGGANNVYIGNVVMEGGTTTAVLFNSSRDYISSLQVGDFVQVSNSNNDNVVLGQSLQSGVFDSENGWYNMGYGSWIGITDEQQETLYDDSGNKIGVLNYQGPLDINIFSNVKQGISFAGERRGKEGIWEWTGNRFIFVYQTKLNNTDITSLTEDFDGLVYTTNKGYIYFLRPHTDSMQSLGGTIYSSNYMYGNRDLAKACGDYVFLFGPDSMGIAYKNGTDERGDYRRNIQVLDRSLGYRNKDSVLVYNEELYMIDNKKRFVKLDLEATTDSYYRVHFKLQATDMSLHWINTDLRNLSKTTGEKVSLCKDDFRIYIIINDSMDTNDNEGDEDHRNTKILVYEDELKYRHWRYMCGLDIRYFSEGQWIGDAIWINQGEEDRGTPFKQIISMTFGDTSWFTWKEVLWIKAAIGYHSKIGKNTVFKFRADGGGFSNTIKMSIDNSSYIRTINKLRESGTTNMEDLQKLFYTMPIGIGMYSGNGVGLIKDITRTPQKEFDAFCDYEEAKIYKTDTCCDNKPASEADGNGCTMKAPDPDAQNFGSSRFQYHYNIAKYSTVPIDIGQQGQNFYFELVANEYDSIEFLGFMVGRMFMDNNLDSIMNKPYYQDTPKDSLPGMMGK